MRERKRNKCIRDVETKIFFNLNANLQINEFKENVKSLSVFFIKNCRKILHTRQFPEIILLSRKYGKFVQTAELSFL